MRRKEPTFATIRRVQIVIDRMYNSAPDDCECDLLDYVLHVADNAVRHAKICTLEDACAALKMASDNSDYLDMYSDLPERVLRWLKRQTIVV